MKIQFVSLILFFTIGLACKKEKLNDVAPSLVGVWKHYSSENDWHILHIYDNSDGKIEWFTKGKLQKDTKVRTWYMKNNTIYFGKLALNGEFYEILSFPVVSTSTSVHLFDTLYSGKRFIELKAGKYVEQ